MKGFGEVKTITTQGQEHLEVRGRNDDGFRRRRRRQRQFSTCMPQLLTIDLIRDEILKHLDGSALISLSGVNNQIHKLVTSSKQAKSCVKRRVPTNALNFCTIEEPPLLLTGWAGHLTHLTLVCKTDIISVCPNKFSSLDLPNVSCLEMINESKSYSDVSTLVNKILSCLSANVNSLSLPYDFLLNPINFDHGKDLEELKFTTATYEYEVNQNLLQSLNFFASTCINLKSLVCQELVKVHSRYVNLYNEDWNEFFEGILSIIEANSFGLEKLEFGISGLLANRLFSSNFAKISFPNLKFFDLRAVEPRDHHAEPELMEPPSIIEILNNLPHPEQLTTLKLTITKFPPELFHLIPQKFPQLKSLSLKASKYNSGPGIPRVLNDHWSFLQSLTKLEELEITRFIKDEDSYFGFEISENFPDFFQENNLRKLTLRLENYEHGSTFFNGITKMVKLKELTLTGYSVYVH